MTMANRIWSFWEVHTQRYIIEIGLMILVVKIAMFEKHPALKLLWTRKIDDSRSSGSSLGQKCNVHNKENLSLFQFPHHYTLSYSLLS